MIKRFYVMHLVVRIAVGEERVVTIVYEWYWWYGMVLPLPDVCRLFL